MLSSKCDIGSKVEERLKIRFDTILNNVKTWKIFIVTLMTLQNMTCKGGHEDSLNLQLEGS